MKKIFTLIAALFTVLSSWALVPQLLFGDAPIVPGKTYETGYEVEDMVVMQLVKQEANLNLKGMTGLEAVVQVTSDKIVSFCSGSNCTYGTDQTKTIVVGQDDVIATDGDYSTIHLLIDVITTVAGTPIEESVENVKVHVKAYYLDFPEEVTETDVILTNKPASEIGGVAGVNVDGSIQIGANTINYNVAAPTKFALYNTSGSLVMSRTIYKNGTITLDSLHPGVYIYSVNGQSGKILVRK